MAELHKVMEDIVDWLNNKISNYLSFDLVMLKKIRQTLPCTVFLFIYYSGSNNTTNIKI